MPSPPVLISLSRSLTTGGVTTWAVRLASALAARSLDVTFLVHPDRSTHADLPIDIHPRVNFILASDLPPMRIEDEAIHRFVPYYHDLIARLADRAGAPVVVSPNDIESSYGILAAICLQNPDLVRVVGWQHTDTEYALRIKLGYESILQRIVGVSGHICQALRERLPHRAGEIDEVPYGVPVPSLPVRRDRHRGRALRMIYTGRMDHDQKRIMSLIHLSDELERRGIDHRLVLLGDGPASDLVDRACAVRPFVRRLPAIPPGGMATQLDRADVFVLGSAFEGMSISMLEAMARGCVPIVTDVRSGAGQAIHEGRSGFLATGCGQGVEEAAVGRALADAVERYLATDPREISRGAWEAVRDRCSIEAHAAAADRVFELAAAGPARAWPGGSPCILGVPTPGAAPGYAPEQLRRLLRQLEGKNVALHAAGRHTLELGHVLARSPARIVGFTDDDRAQHGTTFWGWPIVAPENAAAALGATDIIISSWMFQEAIYERSRTVYEQQGLTVHRLYRTMSPPSGGPGRILPELGVESGPGQKALEREPTAV